MKLITTDINQQEFLVKKEDLIWRPSVYGILIKDQAILLSPQFDDRFDLPGGGMNIDENFEETLVREFKEETGLTVQLTRLLTAHDNLFRSAHDRAPQSFHSIQIFYVCSYVSGEISTEFFDGIENEYMKKAEWIDIKTLDTISVASSFDWREVVHDYVGTIHGN